MLKFRAKEKQYIFSSGRRNEISFSGDRRNKKLVALAEFWEHGGTSGKIMGHGGKGNGKFL